MPTSATAYKQTDPSIVDYLTSQNQDSSFGARTKLAADNGITDYTGTTDQNTSLLTTLKNKAIITTAVPPTITDPNAPLTSSGLEKATQLPDPTALITQSNGDGPTLSEQVSNVAKTVFNGNQLAIDNLRKQQEDELKIQKDAAQSGVDNVTNRLNTITNTTQLQDKLNEINTQFDIPNQIKMLTDISQRVVQAQDALNVGLAYENDRPARQKLVTGRLDSLRTQGIATIGALQGVASVIQGNINLAKSYAEETLGAIKDDNARSVSALNTLLNLYNNKLVDLTKDEQQSAKDRITALTDQVKQLDKDKGEIQDFMTKYPSEFLKGGVTLTDSKDAALKKMLPYLAKTEQLKLAKALQTKASGSGTQKDAPKDKTLLLTAKSNGMPYYEAILAFADTLTPAYIDSIYPEEAKQAKLAPTTGEQRLKDTVYNQLYSEAFDEKGNIKPGFSVVIDPKTGAPTINRPTTKDDTQSWWSKIWN